VKQDSLKTVLFQQNNREKT